MESQKDRILMWLRAGHTITQLQALKKFGIMRLGAVVFTIKEEYGKGYIAKEMIEVTNRYGQKVFVARYML